MSIHPLATLENQPEGKIRHRFVLIDGLRGMAALAVAGYHFYQSSPLHESLSQIIPTPIGAVLARGWLGVDVFFVISGFVIAYSLRNVQITPNLLGNFTLRRLLRLSPPYWVAIALALSIKYLSNLLLSDRTADLASPSVVLAHFLYLQNILGMDDIVPVFWTLCLEIQFYFVLVILLSLDQILVRKKIKVLQFFSPLLFLFLFLGSLIFKTVSEASAQTFFYPSWCTFFLGTLTCWALENRAYKIWYWIYLALATVVLFIDWDIQLLVALVTGLGIYLTAMGGQIEYWLGNPWQQYLGKISYSFYLIHIPIGMSLINIGYRISRGSFPMSLLWFFLAFTASIVAAHWVYQLIERPSLMLSRKFKFNVS